MSALRSKIDFSWSPEGARGDAGVGLASGSAGDSAGGSTASGSSAGADGAGGSVRSDGLLAARLADGCTRRARRAARRPAEVTGIDADRAAGSDAWRATLVCGDRAALPTAAAREAAAGSAFSGTRSISGLCGRCVRCGCSSAMASPLTVTIAATASEADHRPPEQIRPALERLIVAACRPAELCDILRCAAFRCDALFISRQSGCVSEWRIVVLLFRFIDRGSFSPRRFRRSANSVQQAQAINPENP